MLNLTNNHKADQFIEKIANSIHSDEIDAITEAIRERLGSEYELYINLGKERSGHDLHDVNLSDLISSLYRYYNNKLYKTLYLTEILYIFIHRSLIDTAQILIEMSADKDKIIRIGIAVLAFGVLHGENALDEVIDIEEGRQELDKAAINVFQSTIEKELNIPTSEK